MAGHSQRIHYLSDCYRADNRGRVIADIFHDSVLQRCGVAVMPIPYHRWRGDQSVCRQAIREFLEPGTRS